MDLSGVDRHQFSTLGGKGAGSKPPVRRHPRNTVALTQSRELHPLLFPQHPTNA